MAFDNENVISGKGPQAPAVVCPQNGSPVIAFTLYDPALPNSILDALARLNLQDDVTYASWDDAVTAGCKVLVGAREHWRAQDAIFAVEAEEQTSGSAATGKFKFRIPKESTTVPGLYLYEAGLYGADGSLILATRGYLEIVPSVAFTQKRNAITVASIRQQIRDTHPLCNRVLEEVEFSIPEIHEAINNTIAEYNSEPPIMGDNFSASSFPYPERLAIGTIARLLRMAAIWYARNDMQIQGQGLSVDDMAKCNTYSKLADQLKQEWLNWVKVEKRARNVNNGWATVRNRWP